MNILGIDGGGTHTRIELRTGDNAFLHAQTFGPFNMASIGEEAFRLRLREVFAACGSLSEIGAICIGGAGTSGSAMETVLREELKNAGFAGKLSLRGDHEIALAGAMEGPGCILIAGTGSVCCGRNGEGKFVRCGGWGHLLDDGGSAYAIARAGLAAALQTEDGRRSPNALHDALLARLHGADARDIVNFVYYQAFGKAEIAALAPVVLQCAGDNDPVSLEILSEQAEQLRLLAVTAARRLELEKPKLALIGGLLGNDNVYSRMVRQTLGGVTELVPPAHDPVWGAAQLAYERLREDV